MQTDWLKQTREPKRVKAPDEPASSLAVKPPPAVNENRSDEPITSQSAWPLLVIAFGVGASAAWVGLLLWFALRWWR